MRECCRKYDLRITHVIAMHTEQHVFVSYFFFFFLSCYLGGDERDRYVGNVIGYMRFRILHPACREWRKVQIFVLTYS